MSCVWEKRVGMPEFIIRIFTRADIPQIMALQQAYQQVYAHASVIPAEVYLSSGFEAGKNICCAFDESGSLLGYAPLFPALTEDPKIPHTLWVEVKTSPQLGAPREVKDGLFARLLDRAAEITYLHPGHRTRLTFQYHPSETPAIDYVLSKGCVYTESVFRLMRDLSGEIPVVPPPFGIQVRPWRMQTEPEQQAYVQARNEAFPDAPVTLADWQYFLGSPVWQEGTHIAAFDGQEVVGCVSVYWDEAISQPSGRKGAYTEYIFVREKWRKRGIAPYMICQALIYLRDHDREAAFLEVKAANQHALDLYYRLGYQLIDETRLYVLEL